MVYPYDDGTMKYDYVSHRYVLTPTCVLNELNINLANRLNTRGAGNAENFPQDVLNQISIQIYGYIYRNNSQWLYVQKLLAKCPSARLVIKEAMKQQVLYLLENGQLDKYAGINLMTGNVIDLNKIRGEASIDPQALDLLNNPLAETGKSLLYRGRYCSMIAYMPKYAEEGY